MDKAAIITGAAGGVGTALCRAFSDRGYRVVASDLRAPDPAATHSAFVAIDLAQLATDRGYRAEAIQRLLDAVGERALAVLVNNAATQVTGNFESLDGDDLAASLAVNVSAPFLLVQGLLTRLECGGGSVVNISSIHARLTKPGFSAYATSKAALSGMTRALAVELGSRCRINAIVPAAIDTSMLRAGFAAQPERLDELTAIHPVGRIGAPEEVAALAVFLASDAANFITGAEMAIDGGIGARLHDPY